MKRIFNIRDLSGYQINVVLWGERATTFDGESIIALGQVEPVIVLFVGTLVKNYEGRRGVSGSAACRWYINGDVAEMTDFHTRLQGKYSPIEKIVLQGQTVAEVNAHVDIETKTVDELLALDIYDNRDTRFFCSVTLSRASSGQRWWFMSCSKCHKSSQPYGPVYRYIDPVCSSTEALPRYRICFIGADDTNEAEFLCFERAGKDIVGKSLITLLRDGHSNRVPLDDIVQTARGNSAVPRDVSALIGRKYRFVVSISTKSFLPDTEVISFQVNRIDVPVEKGSCSAVEYRRAESSGQSGSNMESLSRGDDGLSPAVLPGESDPPLSITDSQTTEHLNEPKDSVIPKGKAGRSSPASVNKSTGVKGKTKDKASNLALRKPLFPNDPAEKAADLTEDPDLLDGKASADMSKSSIDTSTEDALPSTNKKPRL